MPSSKKKRSSKGKGATAAKLRQELEKTPSSRRYTRALLKREIKNAGQGRGSASRGARGLGPQKGRERHALRSKKFSSKKSGKHPSSGKGCFMVLPEGFPVCDKNGNYSLAKMHAAYSYACKYRAKYPGLAARVARKMKRVFGEYPKSYVPGGRNSGCALGKKSSSKKR